MVAFLLSSPSFHHIGKFQAGDKLTGDSAVETDISHNRHFRNDRETGSSELLPRLLGLLLETGEKLAKAAHQRVARIEGRNSAPVSFRFQSGDLIFRRTLWGLGKKKSRKGATGPFAKYGHMV